MDHRPESIADEVVETGIQIEFVCSGLVYGVSIQGLVERHRLVPNQQRAVVGLLDRIVEGAEVVERHVEILAGQDFLKYLTIVFVKNSSQ
nr:hypothetical protein DSM43518_00909 [Mycobacterium marinum]RFZ21233.1 hypothetical protein DSM43519_03515 [Mycobacterium marinum]BBC66504.1 hypothetical protein MMRN_34000 [Mycobacterium marinum]